MNKLIVDNQLQQKNTTNMITVAEDSLLIFAQPTDPIYLLIANSLTLEIECHAQVTLYIFNPSYDVSIKVHLQDQGHLDSYVSLVANHLMHTDITICHETKKTISNLFCHGISYGQGDLHLTVNGIVPKTIAGCTCNQTNQLINFQDAKSSIEPNLWMEEYDVIANHAAYIGSFLKETVFYLQTKGLKIVTIYQLLSKAFLYQTSQNEQYQQQIDDALLKIFAKEVKE